MVANNLKLGNAAANAAANAVCALLNSGKLRIYSGEQPATADSSVGEAVLLAELTFGVTAFGNAVDGVATANAITADTSANATGTATWFRCVKSDGTTAVFDGSVGTSGCDLNLNTTSIVEGAEVQVTSLTYTHPKA